jgi:bla regulator protein blaR1
MTRFFVECTIRAALIVGGTAIVLYAMRVKAASIKHRVWTAVLLLMLALPFWITWGPKAPIRILPATVENSTNDVAVQPAAPTATNAQKGGSGQAAVAPRQRLFSTTEEIFLGLYLCGALILLTRLAIGTAKARALARLSTPLAGVGGSTADTASRRNSPGFRNEGSPWVDDITYERRQNDLHSSPSCAAPVTVGFFHPSIMLPENWRSWTDPQLAAVLAHEREHVRRRDPLVQWLALFNRAVFWFHPAAWWLERELSALAEESCDATVLAQGHDPQAYAETLMHMARAVMDSGARVNVAGAAMPGPRLPQRIQQIIQQAPPSRISRARASCVIAACAALAAMFTAGVVAAPQSSTATGSAKTAPGTLAFDAASVKESAPGGRRFGIAAEPGGRLSAHNATLKAIIVAAYDMKPQQIITEPDSDRLLSQRFDIEAKAQDNPTQDEMNRMLQSLLADRFKLRAHRETRPLPVFALAASKPGKIGPQLAAHVDDSNCPDPATPEGGAGSSSIACGDMMMGPGHIEAKKISMADFAASLSGPAGRLVLDRTGFTGTFDLTLKYTPDQPPRTAPGPGAVAPDPLGPSLFTALEEQLGLKLDSQVAPVDVLVVDHVEEPTPN